MTFYQSSYNASSDESPSSYLHPSFTISKLNPASPLPAQDTIDSHSAASTAKCYKSSRSFSKARLHKRRSDDSLAIRQYRRMKWAVVVMTTLMIVASMLLVGVSLAMADHIDDLVRQVSGLTTTKKTITTDELPSLHGSSNQTTDGS